MPTTVFVWVEKSMVSAVGVATIVSQPDIIASISKNIACGKE